jgi:hypothetical protein
VVGRHQCELPPIVLDLGQLVGTLADMLTRIRNVERNQHVLKELLMVTKDEIAAQLGDVKNVLAETGKDVARLVAKFDEAIANGDLSSLSAPLEELRTLAQNIDDAVEGASPEPVPAPEEPTV